MKPFRYWSFLCFSLLIALPAFTQEPSTRKLVEILNADVARSMQYNGKTINRLIGNVQLMHNGAIMSCDSAYLFSSSEFEAYSRIVIIKDDARLTGDQLNYDGSTNTAKVRGKIVRLFDKTATLRTQSLDFDTKENIGHFFNGGTITNNESLIESERGYYYSREKLFTFSDSVEIRNETYDIHCQSGSYNTRTDIATFTGHTSIWHQKGFLSCDYGWYDKPHDNFHFSKKAYIQSKEQEIWADSVFYNRAAEMGDLYGHVQLHDTVQSMIAFGDEAHFFEKPQRAMLTRLPSVAYYSMEDNKPDTLFMRADTLRFTTEPNPAFYAKDTIQKASADSINDLDEPAILLDKTITDSTITPDAPLTSIDSASTQQDSLNVLKSAVKNRPALSDATVKPKEEPPARDTLGNATPLADSLTVSDSLAHERLAPVPDSTIRRMFAHFHARAFRQDVQAACDSFAYSSLDSLGRMFGRPVMWNEQQQITADEINFLTDQKNILRADFLKNAFIVANEQDTFYNQVKGRDIIAYFRNNDIYLIDVLGGAQTVYYLQEDSVVANANLAESTSMQITLKDRKIRRIKYLTKPVIDTYPLDKLPKEKAVLKGFSWREAERPKSRWEICREIPFSSQRQAVLKLTKPTFPITARINALDTH